MRFIIAGFPLPTGRLLLGLAVVRAAALPGGEVGVEVMFPRALHAAQTASPLARGDRTGHFLAVGDGTRLVTRVVSAHAEGGHCERKQGGDGGSADGGHRCSQWTFAEYALERERGKFLSAPSQKTQRRRVNRVRVSRAGQGRPEGQELLAQLLG